MYSNDEDGKLRFASIFAREWVSLARRDFECCCRTWSSRVFEIFATNGCPWNELTCSEAAFSGHLECLKYAHENGCPWDEFTCACAVQSASYGHLECLKYCTPYVFPGVLGAKVSL